MKNYFAIMMVLVLSVSSCTRNVKAEASEQDPVIFEKYCVELKDGKMVLTQDNKPVTMEVALNDGSKVTPAGIVIRKDGTIIAMRAGDCIDKEGNINNVSPPVSPI